MKKNKSDKTKKATGHCACCESTAIGINRIADDLGTLVGHVYVLAHHANRIGDILQEGRNDILRERAETERHDEHLRRKAQRERTT